MNDSFTRLAAFLSIALVFTGCGAKKPGTEPERVSPKLTVPDDLIVTQRTGSVRKPWEGQDPVGPSAPVFTEVDMTLGADAAVYTEPTIVESGVGLHAIAVGRRLVISAKNERTDEVAITAMDLAIITGPNHETDLIRINPGTADLSAFTPIVLKPGEQGARQIPLKYVTNVQGARLVYNNPRQNIRFYVPID